MGRFNMKLELANYADIIVAEQGHASERDVRRFEVEGVVDTGSAHLVIPATACRHSDWKSRGKPK